MHACIGLIHVGLLIQLVVKCLNSLRFNVMLFYLIALFLLFGNYRSWMETEYRYLKVQMTIREGGRTNDRGTNNRD